MLWIDNRSVDSALNLAIEETILDRLTPDHPGFCMLWQNRSTVVVGRFQNARQEANHEFAKIHDIDIRRRITGGGAVYHDFGTLNYSFFKFLSPESPMPKMFEIVKPILKILRNLGLPVFFSGRNDIMLNDRKIGGCASCRKGTAFLCHGCLLVNCDLAMLVDVLRVRPEKFISSGVKSVRSRVANIEDFMPLQAMDIREEILKNRNGDLYNLTADELSESKKIRDSKYLTWEWIYGISPPYTEKKFQRFPWGCVEILLDVHHGAIASCQINGDFFTLDSHDDVQLKNLQEGLKGIKYSKKEIQEVLAQFDLQNIFYGCAPLDIPDLITSDI